VTIDYRINIQKDGVSITQHVDATASPASPGRQGETTAAFTQLSTSLPNTRAAAIARATRQGGDPPGPLGSGTGPASRGGDPPGPLGSGTGSRAMDPGPTRSWSSGLSSLTPLV